MFDISGHQEFIEKRQSYYKGADAVVLVYDPTMRTSIESLGNWAREAKSNTDAACCFIVCENKNDLEDKRTLSREEGRILAKLVQGEFLSVSAKSGEGLGDLLHAVQEQVFYKRFKLEEKEVAAAGGGQGQAQGEGVGLKPQGILKSGSPSTTKEPVKASGSGKAGAKSPISNKK